jgi:hypothetical protein
VDPAAFALTAALLLLVPVVLVPVVLLPAGLAVTGRRAPAGCPAPGVMAILVIAPPDVRYPPAEDWNELTSSAALRDRASSRALWSRCRFAVHGLGSRKPPRAATACPAAVPHQVVQVPAWLLRTALN